MAREALLVGHAAGPEAAAREVLTRFGFSRISHVPEVEEAVLRLRQGHIELLVIPLDEVTDVQLALLEREIRRERHTAVIGTAPTSEPNVVLRALRAGVQEFLVSPPDPKELAGAVDRLVRRSHAAVEHGQVVAVYSSKGGVGTSTVAANLAHGFARNNPVAHAALADLVMTGGGDARVLLNINPPYDLGDLIEKIDRVDAELLKSVMTPAAGGVWVLPAPERPEAEELVDAATVTAIVQQLRKSFAFTVLDCEHAITDRTLAALDAADRIVLVTQLGVAPMRSTQRTLALFRRIGYPSEKLCVVINRFQSGEVLSLADAQEVLKSEIYFKLPNDYRVASTAFTNGVPVAELEPSSKLAVGFAQLAAKLGGGEVAPSATNGTKHQDGSRSRLRNLFGRKRS